MSQTAGSWENGGVCIKRYSVNDRIRASEVRLVDKDGGQLGIKSLDEAKQLASEQQLDLILISPNAKPPVCKIANYGQFMYKMKKKEKESKKTIQVIKELKMSHKISIHDYDVRIRQAKKFLGKKNKVKVTVVFRGRDIVFKETHGVKMLNKFLEDLEEYGNKDNDIVKSGRNLSVMVNPKTR